MLPEYNSWFALPLRMGEIEANIVNDYLHIRFGNKKKLMRIYSFNTEREGSVKVNSHTHFFEVNRKLTNIDPKLLFNRESVQRIQTIGYRLNIQTGKQINFKPGETVFYSRDENLEGTTVGLNLVGGVREVELVEFGDIFVFTRY